MDLKTVILADRSKAHTEAITRQIGDDAEQFAELWELVEQGEPPLPQKASWILDKCVEAHAQLFEPYVAPAIQMLHVPNHQAVHRTLTKVLSRVAIPEEFQGKLYDLCINWVAEPKIPVAIRVHSMSVAANIAQGIPELEEELAFVIKDQMEFGSAGFKARGRHILKKLQESKKISES